MARGCCSSTSSLPKKTSTTILLRLGLYAHAPIISLTPDNLGAWGTHMHRCLRARTRMHARTRACTYTRARTHTHARTHARSHTRACRTPMRLYHQACFAIATLISTLTMFLKIRVFIDQIRGRRQDLEEALENEQSESAELLLL